ncbi:MAG: hypothetical protein ACK5V1_13065 [Planctomycetaceae bacterium]
MIPTSAGPDDDALEWKGTARDHDPLDHNMMEGTHLESSELVSTELVSTQLASTAPGRTAAVVTQPGADFALEPDADDAWGAALCDALVRLEAGRPSPADLAECRQLVLAGRLDQVQIARLPTPWQPLFQALLTVSTAAPPTSLTGTSLSGPP